MPKIVMFCYVRIKITASAHRNAATAYKSAVAGRVWFDLQPYPALID